MSFQPAPPPPPNVLTSIHNWSQSSSVIRIPHSSAFFSFVSHSYISKSRVHWNMSKEWGTVYKPHWLQRALEVLVRLKGGGRVEAINILYHQTSKLFYTTVLFKPHWLQRALEVLVRLKGGGRVEAINILYHQTSKLFYTTVLFYISCLQV